jgi:hypothetical protein
MRLSIRRPGDDRRGRKHFTATKFDTPAELAIGTVDSALAQASAFALVALQKRQ